MKLQSKRLLEKRGWMYDDVKDKKIVSVANKEDGSIVSFVKFPNGAIRAKSKTSFESDQARMAQKIYDEDEKFRTFIDRCIEVRYTPIFEIVGPDNQIVLEYQNTELILLQIRDDVDGSYLDLFRGLAGRLHDKTEDHFIGAAITDCWGIKIAARMASKFGSIPTLDILLREKEENQENIEGWIVTFLDGQMAKIKTNKYIELHGLIGPDAFRENLLIQTILNGNVDDVIAQLVPGEKKDRIIDMEKTVVHKFNHLVQEYINLRGLYFNKFQENRKEFAIKHSRDPMFGYVMKSIGGSFRDVEQIAEAQVRLYITKSTNSLGKAKIWVEELS